MIADGAYNYSVALSRSSQMTYRGLPGHLATITSAGEHNFLYWKLNSRFVWIALSDERSEGVWMHTAGPEEGKRAFPHNFTLWTQYEPTGGRTANCACLGPGGLLDYTCITGFNYVVEFECSDATSPPGRCNRMSK
jgi:hypothetical protein